VRATIKVSEENIATMRMQLNAIEGLPDSEDQSLVLEEQIETAEEVVDGLKAEELAKDQSIVILESTLTQQKNAVKVAQDALKVACNVSELGVTTAEWVEL
jgi:outer membrane protein TolC